MDLILSIRLDRLSLIALLIAIGHQTHAQNENTFGVLLGANASSLSHYDGRTAIGITGGLYWEWKFADSFSIQSNFLYSQRGEDENKATPELRLQYINLPVMTKYYVADNFQVMAGIYWDLRLGVDGDNYSNSDFENGDFGIPVGLSVNLSNYIQIGLTYSFGLTNISDTPTHDFTPRNNWGSVTIALLIR